MGGKNGVLEVLVWAVISMHDGAETRVRVGDDLSKEFLVTVGGHLGSVVAITIFNSN